MQKNVEQVLHVLMFLYSCFYMQFMLQPSPVKTSEKLKPKRRNIVNSDESLSDEDSEDSSDVGQYNNRYRRTMLGIGEVSCVVSNK